MTIDLGHGLRVQTEERCWTLRVSEVVQKGKTKGKEKWLIEGYYTGLDSALRGALRVRAAKSKTHHRDLASALYEIRQLWREIETAVPEVARSSSPK